jgi:hypothetical protein
MGGSVRSGGISLSSLPVGGIERDYVLLFPENQYAPFGGEAFKRLQDLEDSLFGRLEEAFERAGGWIGGLETGACFDSKFLADGGRFSVEDFMPLAMEYAGPESANCLEAVESVAGFERSATEALGEVEEPKPHGLSLIYGPGRLPRLGWEGNHRLGSHYNFGVNLPQGLVLELEACLACLAPLLGNGGLCPEGFCLSPTGLAAAGLYGETDDFSREELSLLEVRRRPVAVSRQYDYRLHVGFIDPPFTRRQAARDFLNLQMLISLLVKGFHLMPPGRPGGRYLLGRASSLRPPDAGLGRLLRHLRGCLCRVLEAGGAASELEPHLRELADSIGAWLKGDEEYLAARYDSFLLKRIFEEMCGCFGVTLGFFNRIAMPLTALACSCTFSQPHSVMRMEGSEMGRVLARAGGRNERARRRLLGLMRKHDVTPEELPALAGMVDYFLSLSVGIHSVFPPSPLRRLEEELWRDRRAALNLPCRPTRAGARATLVRRLRREGLAGSSRADFANVYVFEGQGADIYSMPTPYGPQTEHRRLRLEEMAGAMRGLELEGLPFHHFVEFNRDLVIHGSPVRRRDYCLSDEFDLCLGFDCECREPDEDAGAGGAGAAGGRPALP